MPAAERRVRATQTEQRLHVSKYFLLLWGSTRLGERIASVLAPASRTIAAIVRIAASKHADFVAVVELRDPTQRNCQPERELQLGSGTPLRSRRPRHIVVGKKCDQVIGPWIQRIMSQ